MTDGPKPVGDAAVIAALIEAAKLGLPPDIQEVLVRGNASRGIRAGILPKMLAAAFKADDDPLDAAWPAKPMSPEAVAELKTIAADVDLRNAIEKVEAAGYKVVEFEAVKAPPFSFDEEGDARA